MTTSRVRAAGASARAAAVREVTAIAAAVLRLGGAPPAEAVAAAAGLAVRVVRRRLQSNGPSMITEAHRYFVRSGGGWHVTPRGRALVAAEGGAP